LLDLARRDAQGLGLQDGDLVQVVSPFGTAYAKLRISDGQRPGEAFLPMHWSGFFAARAAAGPVCNPATDALSGQPELKHVPVRVTKVTLRWAGLLLTKRDIRPTGLLYWSRARVSGGWAYELAGAEPPSEGVMLARALLPTAARETLIDYADRRAETWRAACLDAEGRLAEALLVAPPGRLPDRAWLLSLLADGEVLTLPHRRALLSGRAPIAQPDEGRIVCACMGVGANKIAAAVGAGAVSVEAVGQATRAGTNCGSCRSEIRELIHAQRLHAAE
jgi:assimilatory nitrate reductase catalytic subunit